MGCRSIGGIVSCARRSCKWATETIFERGMLQGRYPADRRRYTE